MTITVRNPEMHEAAAATELLNTHSRALHGVDDTTAPELEEFWRGPELEFPDDVLFAERNGTVVGYADVFRLGHATWLDIRATDPDAYEPLLEAAERRANTYAKTVRLTANAEDSKAQAAFERAGYQPFRHSFRMLIDLHEDLPEPTWPDGYVVRSLREGEEERFYDAHMASFADTWEFELEPIDQWRHWMLGESFQPEHWFAVEAGDELAAFAICRILETEPDVGFVRLLGVLPGHRRRGLALALLQHIFRHFADRGMRQVGLGVDAENPTGALKLYERAGMRVARKTLLYQRPS